MAGNRVSLTIAGDATSVARAFQRAADSTDQFVREVDDVTEATRDMEDAVEAGGDAMAEAARDADRLARELNNVDDAAGAADGRLGKLKAVAATAGLAAGAAFVAGFEKAVERSKLNAVLEAQLGAGSDLARQYGKASADLYAKGFGEDAASVNAAVRGVWAEGLVDEDAVDADVKKAAAGVMTVATVMEEEAARVSMAVGQMLRTGMAKNAQEAFDLLVRGQQQGLNKAGDLIDTFNEYSTQFRKLGLDGPTAMGLIQQAMKAGARDSDIAADAVKEFSLRSIDGSKAAADAYRALGLDAKQMIATFAKGGPDAQKAFATVLDRLRGIKDPAERAAAAVGLFGTQAEDLGEALYAMDPRTAAQGLGDIAGAAGKAGDALQNAFGTKVEALKRQIEHGLIAAVEGLIEAGERLADFFKGIVLDNVSADELRAALDRVTEAGRALWEWLDAKIIPKVRELYEAVFVAMIDALRNVKDAFDENRVEIDKFLEVVQKVAGWIADHLFPVLKWLATHYLPELVNGIAMGIRHFGNMIRIIENTIDMGKRLIDFFRDLPGRIVGALSTIADGISRPFRAAFNAVSQAWNNTVGRLSWSVPGWVPGIGGSSVSAPRLPYFHQGGVVPGPPGSELLAVLQAGERVIPANQAGAPTVIEIRSGGSRLDDLLVELLADAVSRRGGNVQAVLGGRRG